MKKVRTLLAAVLLAGALVWGGLPAHAAQGTQESMVTDQDWVRKGQEITVTFSLDQAQPLEEGINALKGTLVYDTGVFEPVEGEDFLPTDGWENLVYNPENGQLVVIHKAGDRDGGSVFTLRLRARGQLNPANTQVEFRDVTFSQGQEDLTGEDKTVAVQVISDQIPAEEPQAQNQTQPQVQPQAQTQGSQTVTQAGVGGTAQVPAAPSGSQDPEKAPEESHTEPESPDPAPQTSQETEIPRERSGAWGFALGAAVLILCLVLVLLAARRGKMKKQLARILVALLGAGILGVAFGGITYALLGKGDLNGDSQVDYGDVLLLEHHLVELEQLGEDQQFAADLDRSGSLTVKDLALLIRMVEKTVRYEVTLTSAQESPYLEKGQDFALAFQATFNHETRITGVTLNGQDYPVELDGDGTTYKVTLKAGEEAGPQDWQITRLSLAGGQTMEVDFTQTLEVLKDIPTLEGFTTRELTETVQLQAEFTVTDPDGALTAGSLELVRQEGEGLAVPLTQEVTSGGNQVLLELEEGQEAQLFICLDYDRTSGTLEADPDQTGRATYQKPVQFVYDYGFTLGELKALGELFSKNQTIPLSFTSANRSQFTPERAVVNGKEYPVTAGETPGSYQVDFPGFESSGPQTLTLEQVILSNGRAFPLEHQTLTLEIQKALPTLEGLEVRETQAGKELEVSFTLQDPDGALTRRQLTVKDDQGATVKEVPFTLNNFAQTLDLPDLLTSSYTLEVTGDWDLSSQGNRPQTGQLLGTTTLQALPRVVVTGSAGDKPYYEKGEWATLSYTLATNWSSPLEKLVVNNLELEATPQEEGRYTLSFPVGSQAGETTLELSRAIFQDQTLVDAQGTIRLEVLRDFPWAENYRTQDDFEGGQVELSFVIQDPDGALTGGTARLTSQDGSQPAQEQPITGAGNQQITFAAQPGQVYTFQLTLTGQRSQDGTQTREETVLTCPVQMIRDYGLEVSSFAPARPDGTPSLYFEKGEEMAVTFTTRNQSVFVPQFLELSGQTLSLTSLGGDRWLALLPAGDQAGPVTLTPQALILENGKRLELPAGDHSFSYEILRDLPQVENFTYQKTENDRLQVSFTLTDGEEALESAQLTITDQEGTSLLQEEVGEGAHQKEVDLTAGERYTVQVTATYDRDTNTLEDQSNRVEGGLLFTQEVTASRDAIQLKNVTSQTLYHGNRPVELLDITQGLPDPNEYYLKIQMEDLPDFYGGIREFQLEDGLLWAVVDQENLVSYDSQGTRSSQYRVPLSYRDQTGDHPLITSARELFAQMAADLDGTFALSCDLDASGLSTGSYGVPGTFTGTLQGNGHTIYNLPVGLFQKLSGATITDLVLEDAKIYLNHQGILAGSIENKSLIQGVYLVDCTLSGTGNMVGGFTGALKNSTVRQSAAINLTLKGDNTLGGIAGQTYAGSRVEDCYVTGNFQGTRVNNLGARVGGITGWHSGQAIERCLTRVQITAPKAEGNGGIIGGPNVANSSLITRCISLGGGTAYRIAGFTVALSGAQEVYEYTGSTSPTNRTQENDTRILEVDATNREFYQTTLGLDPQVWNLDLTDTGRMPTLQGDPLPKTGEEYEILENPLGIPQYALVRAQKNYQAQRETAYGNMAVLLPYADVADWVAYGNSLPQESSLVTRRLDYILPLDETGALVTGLETENPGQIASIRLVWKEGDSQDLPVTYKKLVGNLVAYYQVEGTALSAGSLPYAFRGYVKDLSGLDLSTLAQTAAALDYDTQIAPLASGVESRLYRDHYLEQIQPHLEEFYRALILSQPEYPAYSSSPALAALVREALEDQESLTQALYAYNYYHKWYDISFGGVNLSHLLFFQGNLLGENLTARQLTGKLLGTTAALRGTGKTYDYYTQVLQPDTGRELLDLLATLGRGAGYENPSDWFAAEFDGILVETPPETFREGIRYRIWDLLTNLGSRRQIVLPILTAPQEDMYILAVPSQIILGSLNRYGSYQNKDGGQWDRMRAEIEDYAQRFAHMYGITANWIDNSPELLNSFVNIQYDTRFNFPENPVTNTGEQVKGVTQDPVIKWVYEALNAYSDMGGVGAYANGTDVYWVAYMAIGGDFTFFAMTHESAHNQDGRYFYAGYGRRKNTGAEAHADGNLAQQIEDGSAVFNVSRVCDPGSDITNNLSYERIDTADKVWDYYAEMFDTAYVIDYLAGQAFLRLTPEEQARVAVQVTHIPDGRSLKSVMTKLSAQEFQEMELEDMEDLWDHQIALKSEGTRASAGYGAYGYESFYEINWYQPHNDEGSPDSHSFKHLGQEMLALGGYPGYITYISAKSNTDLEALRTITGDPDITWKEYKMNRYREVEAKLDQIPYFDPEEVIAQFMEAFRKDNDKRNHSVALKRTLYGVVKRATQDFVTGGIYGQEAPIPVATAQELVRAVQENPMGYFQLTEDLDFSTLTPDQGAYISRRFIGVLDGQGHHLTGMSYPLFKEMVYGEIMNLTVESPTYVGNAGGCLALTSKNSFMWQVEVTGANRKLPLVKQVTGGYCEWSCQVTLAPASLLTQEEAPGLPQEELPLPEEPVENQDPILPEETVPGEILPEETLPEETLPEEEQAPQEPLPEPSQPEESSPQE